ncbi:hypothetical protein GF389_05480 [Candidatus Dojkabacteria bacterium]|nr:hypothetical protein [Candidatus Dojkabacteria bacterium]
MNDTVTTNDENFTCLECKNEMELDSELKVGDVIECEFCGLEYEYTEDGEDGQVFKIIEEEK